jgi:hypothetical protein
VVPNEPRVHAEEGTPKVELLFFDGCLNSEALEASLHELVRDLRPDTTLELRRVETEAEARRTCFLGSPTVRVDGCDVEPGAQQRDDYGLRCRLYRVGDALVGRPPDAWVRAALDAADPPAINGCPRCASSSPRSGNAARS